MAANTTPIFALTPEVVTCEITAANTARDGSGSLVTLVTAGTDGTRVERIKFTSAQASAAANSLMVCRVFVTDTSGSNARLIEEVVLSAITASNTVIGATSTITFVGGLLLKSGQLVRVAQSVYAGVQDKVQAMAQVGHF
jgi:hypothetical protein